MKRIPAAISPLMLLFAALKSSVEISEVAMLLKPVMIGVFNETAVPLQFKVLLINM